MNSTSAFFAGALLGCALCPSLLAQSAADVNEGLKLVRNNETDSFTLSWWGHAGYVYFLQQSIDLKTWNYVPVSHLGAGQPIHYGFNSNAVRAFFRLQLTDDSASELWKGDFDGDKICNGDEVLAGMDPFTPEPPLDSDNDGLPDYWEIFHFGDLSRDGNAEVSSGGLRVRDVYQFDLEPNPLDGTGGAEAPLPHASDIFTYDDRDWLQTAKQGNSIVRTFSQDAEGNINSVN